MNLSKKSQLWKGCRGPKKKTPQQIRRYWKMKCLVEWSKCIRSTGRCQKCGLTGRTDAHHIIARRTAIHPGWFLKDNGVELCANCHKFRGAHSDDVDLRNDFHVWVKEYLNKNGIDYEVLNMKCKSKGKMTTIDLKLLFLKLREENEKK